MCGADSLRKMQKLRFRGMAPQESAAARGRNNQIGGNKKKYNTISINLVMILQGEGI